MSSNADLDSNAFSRIFLYPGLAPLVALLSVLIATSLIIDVYKTYSETYDESAHIATGMEWLSHGTYTYELLHPPLARVATAFFPYLAGARSQDKPDFQTEGNAILNYDRHIKRTLALSRLGILPFFWLTCFLVYQFMAQSYSRWHGALSTILLTFCPIVLAHSSLSTTDAPLMAMYLWSVLSLWRFLEKPSLRTALIAGLSLGIACISKFTEMPFYFVGALILGAVYWVRRRRFPVSALQILVALIAVQTAVWAGYRFQIGKIYPTIPADTAAKFNAMPPLERKLLTQIPLPESQFFRGLNMALFTGSHPSPSYLLGKLYIGGHWYFFPIGILSKTPVPLLLAFGIGLGFLWTRRSHKPYVALVLLAGCFAPLPVAMAGNLNIGLRHVLPMFPFMAMIAAIGVTELWNLRSRFGRYLWPSLAALLVVSDAGICIAATPDFLPYFNFTVAPLTDHVLIDSDLDWGQDLDRLKIKARELQIEHLYLQYFGDRAVSIPSNWEILKPNQRPIGWVAVSEGSIRFQPGNYGWLDPLPHTMVGHSIRLYHLDETQH